MNQEQLPGHMTEIGAADLMHDDINYFDGVDMGTGSASEDIKTRLLALVTREAETATLVNELTIKLAEAEESLKQIRREEIPELLEEMGQSECVMADGRKVSVARKVNGSVKEEFRPRWFEWLEMTKNDGIIKTNVLAQFGRGELDDAKKAQKALNDAGYLASLDRSIHAQTQAAFIREYVARDPESDGFVPLPNFVDLHEFREAKVTMPKDPKKAKAIKQAK